jgi:malate synthase
LSSENYVKIGSLQVAKYLATLVNESILPDTGVNSSVFWSGLEAAADSLALRNRALLERRDELQADIDQWLRESADEVSDPRKQEAFLRKIGWLVDEPEDFVLASANVDAEIAKIAGPQLVVPIDNARFALNAANARWGSLYDALYGTDVIDEEDDKERGSSYNPKRGAAVVERAMQFLDQALPLEISSHAAAACYRVDGSQRRTLTIELSDGRKSQLSDPSQFRGLRSNEDGSEALLFANNGLHIEVQISRDHPIGAVHAAGVCDVVLESAITTIEDCEDSVAAVDALDKCRVYENWLGLNKGTLEAMFEKNGQQVSRRLAADREYIGSDGHTLILPGRYLMLIRNVGMHMYTDAVLDRHGQEIPEGFLDALVTAAAAIHGLKKNGEFCQVCAGYAIYGPSCMIVMTTGNGTNGFTLDPLVGE